MFTGGCWLWRLLPGLLTQVVGVVVENFSFVFQTAGTVSLSREEMRSFKKVWTEFDPSRKGHLPRSKFVAFFSVSVVPRCQLQS